MTTEVKKGKRSLTRPGRETLETRYKDDPELLAFYRKGLLVPGWVYMIDDVEADYIAEELSKSPMLRRLWQVRKFARYRKKITPAIAKRLAQIWVENPPQVVEVLATDRIETGECRVNGLLPKEGGQLPLFLEKSGGEALKSESRGYSPVGFGAGVKK